MGTGTLGWTLGTDSPVHRDAPSDFLIRQTTASSPPSVWTWTRESSVHVDRDVDVC